MQEQTGSISAAKTLTYESCDVESGLNVMSKFRTSRGIETQNYYLFKQVGEILYPHLLGTSSRETNRQELGRYSGITADRLEACGRLVAWQGSRRKGEQGPRTSPAHTPLPSSVDLHRPHLGGRGVRPQKQQLTQFDRVNISFCIASRNTIVLSNLLSSSSATRSTNSLCICIAMVYCGLMNSSSTLWYPGS